jgi:hypothetical protein
MASPNGSKKTHGYKTQDPVPKPQLALPVRAVQCAVNSYKNNAPLTSMIQHQMKLPTSKTTTIQPLQGNSRQQQEEF